MELDLLQSNMPFTLASLTFTGIEEGFGISLNPVIYGDSFVAVGAVPMPGAVWLLGSGLLGLFGSQVRKRQYRV